MICRLFGTMPLSEPGGAIWSESFKISVHSLMISFSYLHNLTTPWWPPRQWFVKTLVEVPKHRNVLFVWQLPVQKPFAIWTIELSLCIFMLNKEFWVLRPEPMLAYCQLDSWEHISVKFELEFYHFHSRKGSWNQPFDISHFSLDSHQPNGHVCSLAVAIFCPQNACFRYTTDINSGIYFRHGGHRNATIFKTNVKGTCQATAFQWLALLSWPHFYQTRSAWSVDQGSNKNHSPAYNFAPTVTKFCVMWEGLSLPHDTKFGNCRCRIVDSRAFPSWSLIHGLRWSGLIKAEPGTLSCSQVSAVEDRAPAVTML